MEESLYILVALILGVIIGALSTKLFSNAKLKSIDRTKLEAELKLNQLKEQYESLRQEQKNLLEKFDQVSKEKVQIETMSEQLTKELDNKRQEIADTNNRLRNDFQLLANQILKQTSKEFSHTNQKQIAEILNPLKERISGFEKRVNEVHSSDTKNRSELLGQVKQLMELNQQVRIEANNLTSALKGDTKKQGVWGELILEKVLESSGLEKGVEYFTQVSTRNEDKLLRPDVVVSLPDQKCVVIDSKVSLTAFESYISAASEERQKHFLSQHVASMRQHVKGLSSKNYHHYVEAKSLDFVLMFVPIEAGFSEALKADAELYNFAWDHRIVIVSPTTLLATLRTIASVWRQEKQNRNVIQIAEESGKLYDKFVLLIQDLEKVKKGLEQSTAAYDKAFKKLSTGRGNLISRAEHIKELGAKANKTIDQKLIEDRDEDED